MAGLKDKDAYLRLNFLYQAAHCVLAQNPDNTELARFYCFTRKPSPDAWSSDKALLQEQKGSASGPSSKNNRRKQKTQVEATLSRVKSSLWAPEYFLLRIEKVL
ncbi:hypothetical protein WMY93_025128 [Mugilogobius chulae]|uniref:Uncharacterized protein n=1 Tax=Mugilogobius chulae TaxID=88201 RepID=A0AAW0N2K1_9GOBI